MRLSDSPIYDEIYRTARQSWLAMQGITSELSVATPTVEAGAPSGTVVGKLMGSVSEAVLSIVSGPFSINGAGNLVLTATAAAEGQSQTARVNSLRASPYLSLTQDVEITSVAPVGVPQVTSASSITLLENTPLTHTLTANVPVIWEAADGEDQDLFALSGNQFTFAAKDYENPTDEGVDNTYKARFKATSISTGKSVFHTVVVGVTDELETVLANLSLSSTDLSTTAPLNAVVATISGKTPGSTLDLSPHDGRFFLSEDQTQILRGPTAVAAGSIAIVITETMGDAQNSPKTNNFNLTATAPVAPTLQTAPSISGGTAEGSVLVATPGVYSNATVVTGQWYMGGVAVPGATSLTYTRTYDDVGKVPTFKETASNATGSVEGTSNALPATVNGLLARLALRAAIADATDGPRWTYMTSADNGDIERTREGYVFMSGNGAFSTQSGTSGYPAYLRGQQNISGSGGYVAVKVPVGQPVKLRVAFGGMTAAGTQGFRIDDGTTLIVQRTGIAVAEGYLVQVDGTTIPAADWQNSGVWMDITSPTGWVYIRKGTATITTIRAVEVAYPTFGVVTSGVGPYHVDNEAGSDVTGDGSASKPWKNIPGQAGAGGNVATFDVLAGGTVRLKANATAYRAPAVLETLGNLTAASAIGDSTVSVPGLQDTNSRWFYLCDAGGNITEVAKVAGYFGGTITFTKPLKAAHPAGSQLKAYREDFFRLGRSGTSGNPIKFTSYGGGRAVVEGTELLTGWTAVSSADVFQNPNQANIQKVTLAAPAYSFGQTIHEGSRCLYPAQFPTPGDPGAWNKLFSGTDAFVELREAEYAAQVIEGAQNSGGSGFKLCRVTSPVLQARYSTHNVSLVGYAFVARVEGNRMNEYTVTAHIPSTGYIEFLIPNVDILMAASSGRAFYWCVRYHPYDIRLPGQFAYDLALKVPMAHFRGAGERSITRVEYVATINRDYIEWDGIDFRGFGVDYGGGWRDANLRVGVAIRNSKWSAIMNTQGNGVFRPANSPGGTFTLENIDCFDTGLVGAAQMSMNNGLVKGIKHRDAGRTSAYLGGSSNGNIVEDFDFSDQASVHGNGASGYQGSYNNTWRQGYCMNHSLGFTAQDSGFTDTIKGNTIMNVVLTCLLPFDGTTNPNVGVPVAPMTGGYTAQVLDNDRNSVYEGMISAFAPFQFGNSTPSMPSTGQVVRNCVFDSIAAPDLTGRIFENVLIFRTGNQGLSSMASAASVTRVEFGDGSTGFDGTISIKMQQVLTRNGDTETFTGRTLGPLTGPGANPWYVPGYGETFALQDVGITTSTIRSGYRAKSAFGSIVKTRPGSSIALPAGQGNNALFGMVKGQVHFLAPPAAGTYSLVVRETNSHPHLIGGGTQTRDTTLTITVI